MGTTMNKPLYNVTIAATRGGFSKTYCLYGNPKQCIDRAMRLAHKDDDFTYEGRKYVKAVEFQGTLDQ